MATEYIADENCKHVWNKSKYSGLGMVAEWETCYKCGSERNRRVFHLEQKLKRKLGL